MRVVLLGGIAALGEPLIRSRLQCDCELAVVRDPSPVGPYRELFENADVIVGWPLSAEITAAARNVKLIQVAGAGVDGVPFDRLPPGVTVANTFHHESSIAEHIVMAMLWLLRRPTDYDRRLRQGRWEGSCIWGLPPALPVLEGKSALLIGLGHIAREVARRLRPFGVSVTAVSRDPTTPAPDVDLRVGYDAWEDHLPHADFLIPCCPLTPETDGLIAAPQLARMKPDSFLINAARGRIVEEKALYEALRDGRIAGAAIDVWYQYPADPQQPCYPSQYPFHQLPNVLMTPHLSGWTWATVEGRMRDIAENINRLAAGAPLINVVYVSPRETP